MKRQTILLISILAVTLLSFSCASVKDPDFRGIENIRPSRLGLGQSTLLVDLHFYNPNKFRLKLKKAKGDAWIDDNFLGHFTIDTMVRIPANGDFRLPVKLDVDMGRILMNSASAFFNKEVMVKIEGEAKIGKGIISVNYPVKYEGKQNIEKLIK